jgi:hypothetical protein
MTALLSIGVFLVCVLAGVGVVRVEPVRADVEYFPIPSVSTSKNDGNDAGLIVPILTSDADGELKYIVAPMLIHNSIVGARGVINVFRYEPGGRETRFIGSYTEKIERKVVFSYADPAFSQGR